MAAIEKICSSIYQGFSSIFNVYSPYEDEVRKIQQRTDKEAFREDWMNVRGDIHNCYTRFIAENPYTDVPSKKVHSNKSAEAAR